MIDVTCSGQRVEKRIHKLRCVYKLLRHRLYGLIKLFTPRGAAKDKGQMSSPFRLKPQDHTQWTYGGRLSARGGASRCRTPTEVNICVESPSSTI